MRDKDLKKMLNIYGPGKNNMDLSLQKSWYGMELNRNSFQRILRKRREGWGRMNEMKTSRKVMIIKGVERKLGRCRGSRKDDKSLKERRRGDSK
jgi:hypothetical protein